MILHADLQRQKPLSTYNIGLRPKYRIYHRKAIFVTEIDMFTWESRLSPHIMFQNGKAWCRVHFSGCLIAFKTRKNLVLVSMKPLFCPLRHRSPCSSTRPVLWCEMKVYKCMSVCIADLFGLVPRSSKEAVWAEEGNVSASNNTWGNMVQTVS